MGLIFIRFVFIPSKRFERGRSAEFALGVFLAGVVGDTLGGVVSDFLYHKTGNVRFARLSVILVGFVGAFLAEPLGDERWQQIGWQGAETVRDGAHVYAYLQRSADGRIAIGP